MSLVTLRESGFPMGCRGCCAIGLQLSSFYNLLITSVENVTQLLYNTAQLVTIMCNLNLHYCVLIQWMAWIWSHVIKHCV